MESRFENRAKDGGYNYRPETEEYGALAQYSIGETVEKTVQVMSCFYSNEQGYRIYEVEENDRRFVIAGIFPYALILGNFYRITGEISLYKKKNRQIKISTCESTFPKDERSIIEVLRTLHGLDTQAYMLYKAIGNDVLNILMKNPQDIVDKVKGIGIKRAKSWQQELLQRGADDRELAKLFELGLKKEQAVRLVSEYGVSICEEILKNPYFLVGKIKGFSFKTCDKLALERGMAVSHPSRIREGVLYTMGQIERTGNCSYLYEEFYNLVHETLDIQIGTREVLHLIHTSKPGSLVSVKIGATEYPASIDQLSQAYNEWKKNSHKKGASFSFKLEAIDDELIESTLFDLRTGEYLVIEEVAGQKYVTPGKFYKAEVDISAAIRTFLSNEMAPFNELDDVILETLRDLKIELEDKQMEAVRRICRGKGGIFVLNGSAGCGKTFTLNVILEVLHRIYNRERKEEFNPCILAPTGKAAKVAAKSTSLQAYTIHKALGLVSSDDKLGKNDCSLWNNIIPIDEVSMVDEVLCASLLNGIPKTSKVILLGDTAQLPSIRAGRVLKDIIESGIVPTITLDVVKRQSSGSGVLKNATKVNRGEMICTAITSEDTNSIKGNAYVIEETNPYVAQKKILKNAEKHGLKAFQEGKVQILSPVKAGPTGTIALNYYIQQQINPCKNGREVFAERIKIETRDGESLVNLTFREGDSVIHTKNNYKQPWYKKHPENGFIETSKMGVINGDTGVIDTIRVFKDRSGNTHKVIYVNYDGHYIAYEDNFEELALAYALTIHKAQGSQWPIVICPIVQNSLLLHRKLLYTMYTRAQDANILIGNPDYIYRAVKTNREENRITLLKERIKGLL